MYRHLLHIAPCLLLAACCSQDTDTALSCDVRFDITVPQGMTSGIMRMALFDSASGSYLGDANLTGNIDGGVFRTVTGLRTGKYDAYCYNPDIPDTFVSAGKDKSDMYFYTEQVTSDILARLGYDDSHSLHHTPDLVCGAIFSGIVAEENDNTYSADALPVAETWTIEVNGTGLRYAQAAGVVISGLPVSCHPYNAAADVCGDVWTALSIAGDRITGSFNVFKGRPAEKQSIVLSILDSNGKSYLYPLDCTELMAEARRDGTMLIRPEASIEIPEPQEEETGGGFQPSLGDWNYQKGEIII